MEAVLADPIVTNSLPGTYTNFVNLLDLCGVAVPAGRRADGLPMSITLLAAAGRDSLIAGLARDIQAAAGTTLGATPWLLHRLLAATPAGSDDDGIELAVVDPTHQACRSVGHLKEAWRRVLPGDVHGSRLPPLRARRPGGAEAGLIRAANGDGASIDVEVWRIGAAAFGRFVAAIPPPLSIGTIELEGGRRCEGFLAEAAGLEGATDISEYGGWRPFALSLQTSTLPDANITRTTR